MNSPKTTWCYTLNNPSDNDVLQFKSFVVNKHRCALEIGDSGTRHLQGVITWKRAYRLSQLKKLNDKVHWEPAICKDAENYCTKGEIIIDENNRKQGERTDLMKYCDVVSGQGIREASRQYPHLHIKYYKGARQLIEDQMSEPDDWVDVEVIALIGKCGVGKSKKAREIDRNLYSVPQPENGGTLWFDNYKNQETILFDDFKGNWCSYTKMLQLLDGYPMLLQTKGGFTKKRWKRVIITSNFHPNDWYKHQDNSALLRRIKSVIVMEVE